MRQYAKWPVMMLGVFLLLGGCHTPVKPERPTYLVTRIIDGKTIEIVDSGGIHTRVRLHGVDAPELEGPGGLKAKAELEGKLKGRRVCVTPYGRDRRGRVIGVVVPAPDTP